MPIIKLNEQDLSWYYRQRQPGQLTVLVPGVSTFGPCDANSGGLALVTEDNFTKTLGTSSVDSRDLSYQIAKSYVRSGIDVLFWRVPLEGMTYASHTFGKTDEKKTSTITINADNASKVVLTAEKEGNIIQKINSVSVTSKGETSLLDTDTYKVTGLHTNKVTLEFDKPIDTESTVTIVYEEGLELLTIQAKYAGTFGNSLSVKIVSVGTSTYRVLVYGKSGVSVNLLETLLVDFTNMDSQYYYDTVNRTSEYITFENVNTKNIKDLISTISSDDYKLTSGSDGTYSPEAITDYLASSKSDAVFSELMDPLSHVFNIVTAAGYNNYERFVFDKTITASEVTAKVVTIPIKGVTPEDPITTENFEVKIIRNGIDLTTDKNFPRVEVLGDNSGYNKKTRTVTIKNKENQEDPLKSFVLTVDDHIEIIVHKSTGSAISQIDDKFINLCENTGLAVYLVDGAQNMSADEFYIYTGLPNSADSDTDGYSANGFNSSYAAAVGPWSSAVLTSNGVTRMLPGSYVLLTQWAQSLASGVPLYYAPAGVKRASLNFVNSTAYPVGSAVLEEWQNQEITVTDGHKVIPITNLRQYGYVIYGNSTLLKNLANGATSMLQSLSTRILANAIKSRAFDISLTLQFDQLSSDLFIEFREQLNTFMSQLKYNNALYDYQIVADSSKLTLDNLNSRTVPVKIRISPTPAAENFIIDLEISQAGITFGSDDLD